MSKLRKRRGPRENIKKQEERSMEDKEALMKARQSARARRKKRKNSSSNIVTTVLILICVVIFCISGIQLFSIYSEYKEGEDTYDTIAELAITVPEVEVDEEDPLSYEYYYVDFDLLLAENSDIVGWLRFDSPDVINYPILQGEDNNEYLRTTYTMEANTAGSIFIDASNSSDFLDDNTIIYGHNMKNDTMFGLLDEYNSGTYYEEYPYFYLYTPDGQVSKYQVVSARVVDAVGSSCYTTNFGSSDSYQSYIDEMLSNSYYDTGTEITTSSKMVTLSTCTTSDTSRFIVQGVKIEEKTVVVPEE